MAQTYDSVGDALLQEARLAVEAIGLSIGGTVLPVKVTKLPTAEEGVDTVPLVAVCPGASPPRPDQPWDTGGDDGKARMLRERTVDVVAIAPSNRDPVTGLPEYLEWAQKVSRRFGQPLSLPAVAELYETRVEPFAPIDRAAYSRNYDYSGLSLRFRTVEPAT